MSDDQPKIPDFPETASASDPRLADLFRQMRRDRGLTQKELATRSGISQPEISRIENGETEPTYQRICVLCQTLGYKIVIQDVRGPEDALDLSQFLTSRGVGDYVTILLSHPNKTS